MVWIYSFSAGKNTEPPEVGRLSGIGGVHPPGQRRLGVGTSFSKQLHNSWKAALACTHTFQSPGGGWRGQGRDYAVFAQAGSGETPFSCPPNLEGLSETAQDQPVCPGHAEFWVSFWGCSCESEPVYRHRNQPLWGSPPSCSCQHLSFYNKATLLSGQGWDSPPPAQLGHCTEAGF